MAEEYGLIDCDLCSRQFKKYEKNQKGSIYGLSEHRTKTWSLTMKFVDSDKSEINKHICSYCIADVLNEFEI